MGEGLGEVLLLENGKKKIPKNKNFDFNPSYPSYPSPFNFYIIIFINILFIIY